MFVQAPCLMVCPHHAAVPMEHRFRRPKIAHQECPGGNGYECAHAPRNLACRGRPVWLTVRLLVA